MPKTECHCPNCNGPAMKEEDEITCAACDATFIVKQKEIKVKQIGTIEDLSQRVKRLEGLLPGDPPKKEKPGGENKYLDGRGPDGSDGSDGEDGGEFIVGHGR